MKEYLKTTDRIAAGEAAVADAHERDRVMTFTGRLRPHNARTTQIVLQCTHCRTPDVRHQDELKNLRRRPLCGCGGIMVPLATTEAIVRF